MTRTSRPSPVPTIHFNRRVFLGHDDLHVFMLIWITASIVPLRYERVLQCFRLFGPSLESLIAFFFALAVDVRVLERCGWPNAGRRERPESLFGSVHW